MGRWSDRAGGGRGVVVGLRDRDHQITEGGVSPTADSKWTSSPFHRRRSPSRRLLALIGWMARARPPHKVVGKAPLAGRVGEAADPSALDALLGRAGPGGRDPEGGRGSGSRIVQIVEEDSEEVGFSLWFP